MKKSGFTLIELLAVITLLAMIALIATPQVTKMITESKRDSFRSSAEGLMESAEQAYTEMQYEKKITEVVEFNLTNGKNIERLEVKGVGASQGYININPSGFIEIAIYNEKYCAVKKYEDKKVKVFNLNNKDCTVDRME